MRSLAVLAALAATFWVATGAIPIGGQPTEAAQAKEQKKPLVDQVKDSIDRGVKYLREQQKWTGGWEVDLGGMEFRGGWTSLSLLALLNAGVPVNDWAVKKGLDFLRSVKTKMTYVRALQTMVFAEAGLPEDRERIEKNVKWLIDAGVKRNGRYEGHGYFEGDRTSDNSNTQYAILGLSAGRQAGVEIKREIWESIRDYYLKTQEAAGGWIYSPHGAPILFKHSSVTMTPAGLCGILIAGMELNVGREAIRNDGTASNCGAYAENSAAAKALTRIRKDFKIDLPQRTFYHLYGMERMGRLSGQRFLGKYDWYREGCEFLIREQKENGAWHTPSGFDRWPEISTSFALLFLSKGRTPVLISKVVHGPWPRNEDDNDWNNDKNDLRRLVDYCASNLFKNKPLAWQVVDLEQVARVHPEKELHLPVAALSDSPIWYVSGHKSPVGRFTKTEKAMLNLFVESGGFLLAEACCGSADFDRGFKKLAAELWPDSDLQELPADHAIWKSHFTVEPGKPFKLLGLNQRGRTAVVYSPQDLSCLWESGDLKEARDVKAFQLGANIVAYATKMEMPPPRLTKTR
jgi:hypothetical protein